MYCNKAQNSCLKELNYTDQGITDLDGKKQVHHITISLNNTRLQHDLLNGSQLHKALKLMQ